MSDHLATDQPLSQHLRATFDAVLDHIVPADEARGKPSAKDVGVLSSIQESEEDALPLLRTQLASLNDLAELHFQSNFVDLEREATI